MAQQLVQTQQQKQVQQQRLTQQQYMMLRMLEMPLNELEESVNAELDDNPALETTDTDEELSENESDDADMLNDAEQDNEESEERNEAIDEALETMASDDEMPVPVVSKDADFEEYLYGDTVSFYDKLKEQMAMEELTPQQAAIMEYMIGSLDDDGLLRKSLDTLADELAIYQGIDVTPQALEEVLAKIQTFDPAGVGARNLQECLLLQIERRPEGKLRDLMERVITHYYNEFTHKHWDKIQQELQLNDMQIEALKTEIVRLNPKPGAALGETQGRSTQQITPDFVVDVQDDGTITFTLNQGRLPDLTVAPSFVEMVKKYRNNRQQLNRQEKEAMLYAKDKVDRAQNFIAAVKQRQQTLIATMQAIIKWQHTFFLDGDESELRPMTLKDISGVTGTAISTVSRVASIKYVQTKWGIFPLKFFFNDGYDTGEGEETSTRKIRIALKELVDSEDKKHPLSDDALAMRMKELGFPVARRTVVKYRHQLDIPMARMRKK